MKTSSSKEQKKSGMCGTIVLGVIGAILAFIGSSIYAVRQQIMWTLHPETMFPHTLGATPDGVLPTCDNITFTEIRTARNVHDFEEAVRMLRKYREPIIFRNFLPNAEEIWEDIYELQKKTEIAFHVVKSTSFGNLWFRGAVKEGKITASIESVMNTTYSDNPDVSLSASFVQFLDEQATAAIGLDRKRFMADSNFISNFQRDVVSTSVHAALMQSSYSFMLQGVKQWVFISPDDYSHYNLVAVPDLLPVGSSEKQFFESKDTKYFVTQRPGDLLAFPPQWAHAVMTSKGPNVMLNLREFRPFETLRYSFYRALRGIVFKIMDPERRDSTKGLNPLMEPNPLEKRTWHYEGLDFPTMNGVLDSGCKDFFIERMYAKDD